MKNLQKTPTILEKETDLKYDPHRCEHPKRFFSFILVPLLMTTELY